MVDNVAMLRHFLIKSVTFSFLLVSILSFSFTGTDPQQKRISDSIAATDEILRKLSERWQIQLYPQFLRSAEINLSSWEILKTKFQLKILMSLMTKKLKPGTKNSNKFVVSFLGSSVTAGHASNFNVSVSEMTRLFMGPAFDAAGIQLEVINGAMGNNPCLPYDVCVKAFAGPEADIIQWEQSFNCFGIVDEHRVFFEQFIRQSMDMKSRPVIAFTTSDMPNWNKSVCKNIGKRQDKTEEEETVLKAFDAGKNVKRAAALPKFEISDNFASVLDMFQSYRMSGIQLWNHDGYTMYQCHGPYVPGWGDSENWHPSVLGHELRAAHYSFFWLSVYKDALQGILQRLTAKVGAATVELLLTKTRKHYDHEHSHIKSRSTYPSDFSDNMKCLTAFHPINDPSSDLGRYLINNVGEKPMYSKPFFSRVIVEDLMDTDIIMGALERGYKDFKYTFYGNFESKPLSVKIHVQKEGMVFICQPPSTWGSLPDGFKNFWDVPTRMYLTKNITISNYDRFETMEEALNPLTAQPNRLIFRLRRDSAKLVEFNNTERDNTQMYCSRSIMMIPAGRHVLTIVPVTKDNIMISTIVLP